VFWGKPDIEVSAQGLFQPEPQSILVAAVINAVRVAVHTAEFA